MGVDGINKAFLSLSSLWGLKRDNYCLLTLIGLDKVDEGLQWGLEKVIYCLLRFIGEDRVKNFLWKLFLSLLWCLEEAFIAFGHTHRSKLSEWSLEAYCDILRKQFITAWHSKLIVFFRSSLQTYYEVQYLILTKG